MRADVAVVGGGPTGCFVGELLARRGFSVVIIEEHGEIGSPACCAGVVGKGGLRELGIKPDRWLLNEIRGAIFYPPVGDPIEFSRGRVEALVIDRGVFDRDLARKAVEAGATLLLKTKCMGLRLGLEPSLKITGASRGKVEARLVIGADGPTSLVAREAGLLKTHDYIGCAQLEAPGEIQVDRVELHFGRSIAPGFFAWVVPAGEVCRVGLGTTRGRAIEKLLSFASGRGISGQILNLCSKPIPIPLSRKLYADGVMLVGAAAGQVKPLTGGGIYVGLSCAKLAARTAEVALGEEPTSKKLKAYERAVMGRFGWEFKLGTRVRKVLELLRDEDLGLVFGLLKSGEVRELVEKNFDFDHHDKLLRALLPRIPRLICSMGLKKVLSHVSQSI